MAVKKVWLGSTGPFLFDDQVLYIDEEGVIAPDNQCAIATNGQIVVQSAPTSDVHVVRKLDMDAALGNIAALESRVATLESQVGTLSTNLNNTNLYIQNTVEPRILTLEQKFVTGTNLIRILGFAPAGFDVNVNYVKTGKWVAMNLPLMDGNSNYNTIDIINFSSAIIPPFSNVQIPILVFDATNGYDWAPGAFVFEAQWVLRIQPTVKSSGFPMTGRKILMPQIISWSV